MITKIILSFSPDFDVKYCHLSIVKLIVIVSYISHIWLSVRGT